ncbi:MAG: hypothetical protein RLN81_07465 [Balneolaceae bacterium]
MQKFWTTNNYALTNNILYTLYVANKYDIEISKIAIQKIFYLSQVLNPLREIAHQIVEFVKYFRGPYSKNVQNELDHLCSYGLVELVKFEVRNGKNSVAVYKISLGGINAVSELTKYSKEEDQFWWISTILRTCNLFFDDQVFSNKKNEYEGFDNIVNLVYQDPTFRDYESNNLRSLMKFDGDTPTATIIKNTIDHLGNDSRLKDLDYKHLVELLVVGYFNYLYGKYVEVYAAD